MIPKLHSKAWRQLVEMCAHDAAERHKAKLLRIAATGAILSFNPTLDAYQIGFAWPSDEQYAWCLVTLDAERLAVAHEQDREGFEKHLARIFDKRIEAFRGAPL